MAVDDFVTVVPRVGETVAGRVIRLTGADLEVRVVNRRAPEAGGPWTVSIRLDSIQWLERPRDSVRNGAALGAGIGAGCGGAMFAYAFAVDRNEADEWAPLYAGAAAISTGIGALIGWALDAASSKPHMTYGLLPQSRTRISLQPVYRRGPGVALAVSF